jgi:hypothetical protein
MGKKGSILVKLPMQLYVSLHDRQLNSHISFLVSRLLEEFLKAADVRISWATMPSKTEQRRYLDQKLQEFLSGTLKGEYPQERILEKTETVPSSPEVKKEEKKEEGRAEDRKEMEDEELRRKRKEEFLKRYEQFW